MVSVGGVYGSACLGRCGRFPMDSGLGARYNLWVQQSAHPENSSLPKFATYFFTASLNRKNPNAQISVVDVGNNVSEGLWKAFNELRRDASVKLGISELELGISDIKIIGIRIDGHRVFNAEGFTGKAMQITYLMTLAPKGELVSLRGFFDSGTVRAFMAAEATRAPNAIYAEQGNTSTSIFTVMPHKTAHVTDSPWGGDASALALGQILASDDMSANKILYSRFLAGAVSAAVLRKMARAFFSSFQIFINSISAVLINSKIAVAGKAPAILFSGHDLPMPAYERNFAFGGKRAKIRQISVPDQDLSDFISARESAPHTLNEIARLRIGWLI